jgi:putative ABC transport system permease protein
MPSRRHSSEMFSSPRSPSSTTLPTTLQREIFDTAGSVGKVLETVALRGQIAGARPCPRAPQQSSDRPEIERDIEDLLRQRHHIRGDAPSDFRIENPADVLTARGAAVRTLGILLIAVAAVSLVVGGISIMNIMLVSVTERTREIGLRMAVGATRRDIRWQFLIEALILSLIGGIAGAVLGAIAAVAIAWNAGWPILISPWAIMVACGFAGFVGISFGLYPAQKAARLDPIAALRFE